MQLSTSFLPFDVAPVAPVAAAASTIAVPGGSAESQPALGDFGAILASEADVSAAVPSSATAAAPVESIEATSDDTAVDVIVAPAPVEPTQAPPIVTNVAWTGFVTPQEVATAESAIALVGMPDGSDVPTSVVPASRDAAEYGSAVNTRTSADVARAFAGVTFAQPQPTPPMNSDVTAHATTPFVPSPTPSPAAVGDAPLDPSAQSLPASNASVPSQPARTSPDSVDPRPHGSAPVSHLTKENRVSRIAIGEVSPTFAPTDAPRSTGAIPLPNAETHSTQTSGAASPEQPEQSIANDVPLTRSSQAPAANQRDTRAISSNSVEEAPTVADEVTREAGATSAATVSEKRVRPFVDGVHSAPAPSEIEQPRIGDHITGRVVTEKFAAPDTRRVRFDGNVAAAAKKESLSIPNQSVVEHVTGLGTNAAKAEDHMPAPASIAAPASSIERLSHAVEPASFNTTLAESGGEESAELAQVARRAVNAAMEITEQFAASEKNSVTLKFSISGSELGVRVELRGEQVHTTFRTDSPELRAALAQEWQAVNATPATDRPSRLAEPVFTSNASPGATGSDTSGGDQRGSQARQGQFASDEWARYRAAARAADTAPSAVSTPMVRGGNPAAPGRLHTFA